ncbi:flagellar biosynthesis protein FlhB [Halanaerobaculum tunisiense]
MPDEEKTEDPTPKRREEAREEGQVAQSTEISSAFTLLFSFVLLYFLIAQMMNQLLNFFDKIFINYFTMKLTINNFHTLLMEVILIVLQIVAPLMVTIAIVGVLINYLQIGFLFTTKILVPSFSDLNPIEGAKQIISKKTFVELIKSIFKIGLTGYLVYTTIKNAVPVLATLMNGKIKDALTVLAGIIFALAMKISAAFIVLGIADLFYQRWEHEQQLKMSKKEVEEEKKQTEGNPEVKSKRDEKQQEMAQSRMMQDVSDADVVVTNPTHIAVALEFDREEMEAPVVVAMGQDELAHKIKQVAKEHEIEIVEEKPLARSLYSMVDIGDEIPAELYKAVAEILAYVYRLNQDD